MFAVLANRMQRGQIFWRMAFFTPLHSPLGRDLLVWVFIFSGRHRAVGDRAEVAGQRGPGPRPGDPNLAMVGIAVATVWWTIGFNFILYLAGLQDIPRELYEAAAIDGATPWQQIRHLTIPLLSRTTTLVLLLQIIASLKIFDQVYLMTSGGRARAPRPRSCSSPRPAFTDYRIGARGGRLVSSCSSSSSSSPSSVSSSSAPSRREPEMATTGAAGTSRRSGISAAAPPARVAKVGTNGGRRSTASPSSS